MLTTQGQNDTSDIEQIVLLLISFLQTSRTYIESLAIAEAVDICYNPEKFA